MYNLEELKKFFEDDLYATKLLGAKIIEAHDDYAKCEFDIQKDHQNARGTVMGGAIFTLADFTFAVATNQHEDYNTVSTNANISYLRPGTGVKLFAEAIKIRDGKNICFYEVNVYNDKNSLISKVMINGTHIYKEN